MEMCGENPKMSVNRKKVELVFPKTPSPSRTIPLSSIDRLLNLHVFTVFFYSAGGDEAYAKLKDALEKLMCTWDVLAARLKPYPGSGKLECIECGNQGAPMVEAAVEMAIRDIGDFNDKPILDFYRHFLPMPSSELPVSETPLLLAQVTRFSCGGLALGVATSHCIVDGTSAFLLFETWSAICRGVPASQLPVPLIDGSILYDKSKYPNLGIKQHVPVLIREPQMPPTSLLSLSLNDSQSFPDWESDTLLVYSKVLLPGKVIRALKDQVRKSGEMDRFSTFDLVAAHIWRSRVKAILGEFADPSTILSLRFTVDFRPRVVPPLPATYVGNGLWTAAASCCAHDLTHGFSLPQIMALVQQAKSRINDAHIRGMIVAMEGAVDLSRLVSDPQTTTVITDWSRLPFEDVDFGWGLPDFFTPVRQPGQVQSAVQIARGPRSEWRQGSLCLGLGLTAEQLPRFRQHLIHDVFFEQE